MGRGDRKTAKGKRFNSSYGNVRPHGVSVAMQSESPSDAKHPVRAAVKKTVVKKTVAKAGTARSH